MSERSRIYLDHAATSWPKSDAVLAAMGRFARQCGATAGRGGYQSAAESDRIVAMVRKTIATLINAESPNFISLHSNGTAALNAAIHGVLRPGDHVVTTAVEHNSVLRPLHHLRIRQQLQLTIIPADEQAMVDPQQVLDAVRENTRLVAMTHASNVTGAVQPIAEVGSGLRDHPAFYLCDAAQTFGTLFIDVEGFGIDLLAAPGHKSSGGPLGTGFLYASARTHQHLTPIIQGGTGSQSESLEMPTGMPSMVEAGNLNVPAIAGWLAALRELQRCETDTRIDHARTLSEQLHRGLAAIDTVQVFGQRSQLPIASISMPGLSPTDAALVLDAEFGIETRAGLHCAALVHECLGSADQGTLRISAGHTSTEADIDAVLRAIQDIQAKL